MASQKTVLYPGSFDPITKGHIDVILRLKKIFERVVVLVAESTRKKHLLPIDKRVALIREALGVRKGVDVVASQELTVEFARKKKIFTIARSVRTVSDWDHEYALADANKKLDPQLETLFIMADPRFAFISSSLVREVASFGGDTRVFVPTNVARELRKVYKPRRRRPTTKKAGKA